LPQEIEQILGLPESDRTDEQKLTLAAYLGNLAADAELAKLPEQATVYAVGTSVSIPSGNGNHQPGSIAAPKKVHLLDRGDISKPRGEVPPGSLSALGHLPSRFEDRSELTESDCASRKRFDLAQRREPNLALPFWSGPVRHSE
jgi:hypothetical protein